MTNNVTIRNVAREAEVSVGTASAALNGRSSVKRSTREKVEAAARRLGYRKNAAASVLSTRQRRATLAKKAFSVGFVQGVRSEDDQRFEQFQEAVKVYGYDVERINFWAYRGVRHAAEHLRFLNVEGLFLAGSCLPGPEWLKFPWEQFSVVKAEALHAELSFPMIRHRASAFMRQTLVEVTRRGYRRLALLLERTSVPEDDEVRLGMALAMVALKRAEGLQVEWWYQPDVTLTRQVADWLRCYRPDAVITFPVTWYEGLKGAGFQVPEDFALASLYADEWHRRMHDHAGCLSFYEDYFRHAARMLHELVVAGQRGQTARPMELVIEPEWAEGATLPDLR